MSENQKSQCEKCSKLINLRTGKPLICDGECKKTYHAVCVNISDQKYEDLIKKNIGYWFCEICKKKRNKQRNSLIISNTDTSTHTNITPTNTAASCTPNNINLMDIYLKLNELQGNIEEIRNEMLNYKNLAEKLTAENKKISDENKSLKTRLEYIEENINYNKEQHLKNNLLIYGIPRCENENTDVIIQEITKHLGVNIQPGEIISTYRKALKNNPSGIPAPIIIKFNNNKIKSEIMTARRKKNLNTEILKIQNITKRPIYINEQLTQLKQNIYKNARELKKSHNCKYVWTKNGDIFIRKTDNSQIIKIKSITQINDIKQTLQ